MMTSDLTGLSMCRGEERSGWGLEGTCSGTQLDSEVLDLGSDLELALDLDPDPGLYTNTTSDECWDRF